MKFCSKSLAVISVLLLALAACGAPDHDTSAPGEATSTSQDPTVASGPLGESVVNSRTLRVLTGDEIANFDPSHNIGPNWPNTRQLFDTLVTLDSEHQPVPRLAESWELDDDNRMIRLKLRAGVRYSNGDTVMANDVVVNWERQKDPANGGTAASLLSGISEITAVSDDVVEVRFGQPHPGLFHLLDMLYISHPEQSVTELRQEPIGSGPFMLDSSDDAANYVFIANPHYWDAEHRTIERIEINVVPNLQSRLLELENGSADLMLVESTDSRTLAAAEGIELTQLSDGASVYAVLVNVNDEVFSNQSARQALNSVIDRDQIIDLALGGLGDPRCLPWGGSSPAAAASDGICERLPEGHLTALEGSKVTLKTYPATSSIAEVLESQLRAAGIDVDIQQLEQASAVEHARGNDFQLMTWNFGRATRDPAILVGSAAPFVPGADAFTGMSADGYRRVWEALQGALDPEDRMAAYREFNEEFVSQAHFLPLTPRIVYAAHRSSVGAVGSDLDNGIILERATID